MIIYSNFTYIYSRSSSGESNDDDETPSAADQSASTADQPASSTAADTGDKSVDETDKKSSITSSESDEISAKSTDKTGTSLEKNNDTEKNKSIAQQPSRKKTATSNTSKSAVTAKHEVDKESAAPSARSSSKSSADKAAKTPMTNGWLKTILMGSLIYGGVSPARHKNLNLLIPLI